MLSGLQSSQKEARQNSLAFHIPLYLPGFFLPSPPLLLHARCKGAGGSIPPGSSPPSTWGPTFCPLDRVAQSKVLGSNFQAVLVICKGNLNIFFCYPSSPSLEKSDAPWCRKEQAGKVDRKLPSSPPSPSFWAPTGLRALDFLLEKNWKH